MVLGARAYCDALRVQRPVRTGDETVCLLCQLCDVAWFSTESNNPCVSFSCSSEVIGIDLGTTNSCVAVMEGKVCAKNVPEPYSNPT